MSVEDFTTCARHTVGDAVDSWDEVVIQPLIEVGQWFRSQDDTVKWLFDAVAGGAGTSAVAWLGAVVELSAAEVVFPVVAAFSAGVGIGTGLLAIVECASEL